MWCVCVSMWCACMCACSGVCMCGVVCLVVVVCVCTHICWGRPAWARACWRRWWVRWQAWGSGWWWCDPKSRPPPGRSACCAGSPRGVTVERSWTLPALHTQQHSAYHAFLHCTLHYPHQWQPTPPRTRDCFFKGGGWGGMGEWYDRFLRKWFILSRDHQTLP